jgi:Rrf2 family protein
MITIKSLSGVVAVAVLNEVTPTHVGDISDATLISVSYLEQLFKALREAGMVEGVRGPGGGYLLTRAASKITLADIITAFESRGKNRITTDQPAADALMKLFKSALGTTTLADLQGEVVSASLPRAAGGAT